MSIEGFRADQTVLLPVQIVARIDPNHLSLIIDGWTKPFGGGSYLALLLRSWPDDNGNSQDWLIALTPFAESRSAEAMAAWVQNKLVGLGLDTKNIDNVAADNASAMTALCALLGGEHIGCSAHLIDLVVDGAWALIQEGWPHKVQKIISSYHQSPKMAEQLKSAQTT